MKVLMISLDKGMFGGGFSGDVAERHQKYADLAGSLDVLILSPGNFQDKVWSQNFRVFSSHSTRYQHFYKGLIKARDLHQENQYDLLITQDFAAPIGARFKKAIQIPWIVTIHGMFFEKTWIKNSLIRWFWAKRIKSAIKFADGFKVNNQKIKDKLKAWGIKKSILIQPTPADLSIFKTDKKPKNKIPKFLYVGRLSPEKNVELLIRAVNAIEKDYEFLIVGGGAEREKLEKLSKGNSKIKFLGPKTKEELVDIYRAGDVLVLPSNTESYGVVLLQASAAGCALIATKTTGATKLINDGQNGLLVDIDDEKGLRGSIEKLLSDKNLRDNLGKNARKDIESYDSEKGINKVVDFWEKIVNN